MTTIRNRTKGPSIIVSETDRDRLRALVRSLIGSRYEDEAEVLSGEIERAEVVPLEAIPADVITLYSTVRFEDKSSGRERDVTLVFPSEADPFENRISVLAPVGAALLGLRVGQAIQWELPNGRATELVVRAVAQRRTMALAAVH